MESCKMNQAIGESPTHERKCKQISHCWIFCQMCTVDFAMSKSARKRLSCIINHLTCISLVIHFWWTEQFYIVHYDSPLKGSILKSWHTNTNECRNKQPLQIWVGFGFWCLLIEEHMNRSKSKADTSQTGFFKTITNWQWKFTYHI